MTSQSFDPHFADGSEIPQAITFDDVLLLPRLEDLQEHRPVRVLAQRALEALQGGHRLAAHLQDDVAFGYPPSPPGISRRY